METDFIDWLQEKLAELNWTQAELSRKSGISTAAVSRVFSGARNIGPDMCHAFARALKLPPDEVFRRAGLLPQDTIKDERIKEIEHIYSQLESDQDKQEILEQSRLRLRIQEERGNYGKARAASKLKAVE